MQTPRVTIRKSTAAIALCSALALGCAATCFAQAPPPYAQAPPPPPNFPPPQLDSLVTRIALYPDPLLAQVLAAATFPEQIPDAARWADQHHYLTGDALAAAINADRLPWDPSVQALLPFPSVLDMMASDMGWTTDLGNAFLAQRQDVMDAVQRMRRQARDFGYLQSNPQITVSSGPYIEILPVNPAFIYVPYYNPAVVFVRPRAGFAVAGAVTFGYGVTIGAAFRPWGWGANRIVWPSRTVIVNNAPWNRAWANRKAYVHPYPVQRYEPPRRVETHELRERTPREREAARSSHERVEEHREEHRDERRR
jgi:hypothetical protein